MKKSNKYLINILLLISSLYFCLANLNTSTVSLNEIPTVDKQFNPDYITHGPIEIISDDNFTDYGFLGAGTESNPYRIDDLHIQTTGTYGIFVEFVTMHFVITNCLIEDAAIGIYLYGINWNSCRIEHNIVTGVENGIYVDYVTNGTIFDNTIEAEYTGIDIVRAGYLAVINNTISNSLQQGIYIFRDSDTIVTGNKFYNCGILVGFHSKSAFDTFTIEDNLVNDNLLGFFKNQNDLVISAIDDYGQLILYNCHRAAISNQVLSYTTVGIQAYECDNMTIYDCDFEYSYMNIQIDYSSFLEVHHCRFKHVTMAEAVNLYSCHDCLFYENYFEDVYAFYINYAINLVIRDNDFNSASWVAYITGGYNLAIYNNWILDGSWGFLFSYSDIARIYDNIIYNLYIGMELDNSNNFTVYNNLFQEIDSLSINLNSNTENCTIYHNTIVDCNLMYFYTSQAYDNGINNIWYNKTLQEGNYWSDWTSGPYDIDGPAGYQDLYPLSSPTITPFVPEFNNSFMSSYIIIPILVLIPYLILRRKKRKTN